MATTVTGRLVVDLEAIQNIVSGIENTPAKAAIRKFIELSNGTTDGKIDMAYWKTETGIGASVTTAYDLAGTLTNREGTTLTFAEVALIYVANKSGTAANFLYAGPGDDFGVIGSNRGFWSANTWRASINADYSSGDPNSGSFLLLYAYGGVPVTAGTADDFSVITQGGTSSNTWDILILGRSA